MVAVAWYNLLQLQPSTTSPEVVSSLPHCHAKKLPIQVSFGVVNPNTWPFLHKNHMVLVVSYSDSFLPWFPTLVPLDCLIPEGLETSTPSMVVDGAWRFKGQHIRPFQHLFFGDGRTQSPQHGLLGKSERQEAEFAEFSELWSSTDKNQGQQRPSTCCPSVEVHNADVLMDPAFTRPMCTNLLFHEGISNSSAELMGAELGNVGGSSRGVCRFLKCVSVCVLSFRFSAFLKCVGRVCTVFLKGTGVK